MVLAALGVCIVGDMSWPEACQVANSAAGLKCERRGAVPVPKAEVVLDLLDGEKVIPAELLPSVRAAQNRVAFTNGVFDLLGPHHLYLLQEARKHGDVLVVGLNDDASVRRLKGPKRPIMRQEQRAAMLAGLACVDYVVMFSEDTPRQLLRVLAPDVLVKADDPERNREGDDLAGEVVLVPMIAGASTTRTLDAIRQ
jgi:D-beta-D-heptose 7-phosphate kinase/D-beta-D-heptose 1-phosphate adenosyltransferase